MLSGPVIPQRSWKGTVGPSGSFQYWKRASGSHTRPLVSLIRRYLVSEIGMRSVVYVLLTFLFRYFGLFPFYWGIIYPGNAQISNVQLDEFLQVHTHVQSPPRLRWRMFPLPWKVPSRTSPQKGLPWRDPPVWPPFPWPSITWPWTNIKAIMQDVVLCIFYAT